MQNELLEFNNDCAILWGVSEYETQEALKVKEDEEEYILIDNPINRIKDIKY
jgi:hypothetical protein